MTNNLLFTALAAIMTAAVLALLLAPLRRRNNDADVVSRQRLNSAIYRDEIEALQRDMEAGVLSRQDHDEAQGELQRRLLEDSSEPAPGAAPAPAPQAQWFILAVLPLAAILLYLLLGQPAALDPTQRQQQSFTQQDVEQMVAGLAAKLESEPDNLQGWVMLARSYKVMGRLDEAVAAFRRSGELLQSDPDLMLNFADTLAASVGEFNAESLQMINKALQMDPGNPLGLWMRGSAAFDAEQYDQALNDWVALRALMPPGAEDIPAIEANIAEARAMLGDAAPQLAAANDMTMTATPAQQSAAAPPAAATLQGRVELGPDLDGKVAASDVVLVFARPLDGSRMPAAVLRATAADLPLTFSLDDSMAMTPQRTISQFSELQIEARISKSGRAMPQAGDFYSQPLTVKLGASDLLLLVDQVR